MILRLLCDRMLGGLARWLRAAGHDTALAAPGESDAEILARCRAEDRVLVSRNRRLVQAAEAQTRAVLLTGEDAEDQAPTLARALGLDWTVAPFTRCMMDNTPLQPSGDADLDRIPARSRDLPGPFRTCPCCGRVFWPGSHVRRMSLRLQRWKDLAAGPPQNAK